MDARIDLDAAADMLAVCIARLQAEGVEVGPITWAEGQTFNHEITTDRARVRGDYSVGVRARKGQAEGQLILHAGGWCDLEYWSGQQGEEPIVDAPGWEEWLDVDSFGEVLHRWGRRFVDSE